MGCVSTSYRRLPHQPKLFLRLLDDFAGVAKFYGHPPAFASILESAKSLDFPPDRRAAVVEVLRGINDGLGAGEATRRNLDRLRQGAVAVVSGQQVGLFGGPAYAFYKALSAIRIAEELTEAGVAAVPVFWMATEDHDLDEIRHTAFFRDGKLVRIELPGGVGNGAPVGRIALGAAVREAVNTAG